MGDRPLKFTKKTAAGSVIPGFIYNTEDCARGILVDIVDETHQSNDSCFFYVNGGPYFRGNQNDNEEILGNAFFIWFFIAWYNQGNFNDAIPRPAILLCKVNQGKAILSGVHFESTIQGVKPYKESPSDSLANDEKRNNLGNKF